MIAASPTGAHDVAWQMSWPGTAALVSVRCCVLRRDKVVTLHRNRGAVVTHATVREAKEQRAERSHDRALELKPSHEFHSLLAVIVRNRVLIGFLKELIARSALITAIYERPRSATACTGRMRN